MSKVAPLNSYEELLLIEYNHQLDFIKLSNDVLLKVALLYTTIIHLIFGAALAIVSLDHFSPIVILILLSLLSILFLIITTFWFASSCSTHIKLMLRVGRCDDIEGEFKKRKSLFVLKCAKRDKLKPVADTLRWPFCKISQYKATFGRKLPGAFCIISWLSIAACLIAWIVWLCVNYC